MKTIYLQCNMGCAGDMLTAALLELFEDKESIVDELNKIGIERIAYKTQSIEKCGVNGTHINVIIDGEKEEIVDECEHHHHHDHDHEHNHNHEHTHNHRNMKSIKNIISTLNISEKVKNDALNVYNIIAMAESSVHNKTVDMIHFHEVGELDAIADIVAVCYLMNRLEIEKVYSSPINVGSGNVHCAHGILPVPAPATAIILEGVPVYSNDIIGELCTPTGAALLKYFVLEFKAMPPMTISKIGYGMGKKDFEAANCVRAFLGNTDEKLNDNIVKLECNMDDITGEELSFATEQIFKAGARDVYTTPIYMKKNRPAFMLSCICTEKEKENIVSTIFKYTTTIGIRETLCSRYVQNRSNEAFESNVGRYNIKKSQGYGSSKEKIEFEDIAKIAREKNVSLNDVRKMLLEHK